MKLFIRITLLKMMSENPFKLKIQINLKNYFQEKLQRIWNYLLRMRTFKTNKLKTYKFLDQSHN